MKKLFKKLFNRKEATDTSPTKGSEATVEEKLRPPTKEELELLKNKIIHMRSGSLTPEMATPPEEKTAIEDDFDVFDEILENIDDEELTAPTPEPQIIEEADDDAFSVDSISEFSTTDAQEPDEEIVAFEKIDADEPTFELDEPTEEPTEPIIEDSFPEPTEDVLEFSEPEEKNEGLIDDFIEIEEDTTEEETASQAMKETTDDAFSQPSILETNKIALNNIVHLSHTDSFSEIASDAKMIKEKLIASNQITLSNTFLMAERYLAYIANHQDVSITEFKSLFSIENLSQPEEKIIWLNNQLGQLLKKIKTEKEPKPVQKVLREDVLSRKESLIEHRLVKVENRKVIKKVKPKHMD